MKMDLSSEVGREKARTEARNRVSVELRKVPQIQPAFIKAIEDRAEKALNRFLHEVGLPQCGTQRYKPAGRKTG